MVLDEPDEFVMNEDEDPRDLYWRLKTLVVALLDHGSKDTNENCIKRISQGHYAIQQGHVLRDSSKAGFPHLVFK